MTRRLILDCDPGTDDAVALLLALASPELELARLTVSHGNVALPTTLRNALGLLALVNTALPVHAGAARPLIRAPLHAPEIHGEGGMAGLSLPPGQQTPEALPAAQAIVEEARAHPGLTLVVTGPLTNAALALRLEPRLPQLLSELVIMGGSTDQGNTTPAAEFNVLADPHAARMVFEAAAEDGLNLTMFGLNLTRQLPITAARAAELRAADSLPARFCADILEADMRQREASGVPHGSLHDPATIAYLLKPELFQFQDLRVWADDTEGLNFGRTLADLNGRSHEALNVKVAMRADEAGFYALLAGQLGRLSPTLDA